MVEETSFVSDQFDLIIYILLWEILPETEYTELEMKYQEHCYGSWPDLDHLLYGFCFWLHIQG